MDEAFRGKGVGKAFFAELGKIAKEKVSDASISILYFLSALLLNEYTTYIMSHTQNCARMDWSVLDVSGGLLRILTLVDHVNSF